MSGFFVALGVVFVAELGDKSQLLVLALAARHSPTAVLGGLTIAATVLMGVSVGVGAGLSAALPTEALRLAAGAAFLAFALWALVHDDHDDPVEEGAAVTGRSTRSGVASTALAVGVAELGDKTMLAAVSLAATHGILGVWVGASLGMVASSSLAIAVGYRLGRRLPERALRLTSAALFAVFGVLLLTDAL